MDLELGKMVCWGNDGKLHPYEYSRWEKLVRWLGFKFRCNSLQYYHEKVLAGWLIIASEGEKQ